MPAERVSAARQENLLALLAHNDEHGKIVANLVTPDLFEGDYRIIAERLIDFWHQNHTAPKVHAGDLFSDILEAPGDRRASTYRRILIGLLRLNEQANADWVVNDIRATTQFQQLKAGVYRAAEILNAEPEDAVDQVRAVMSELTKSRDHNFDPGRRLDNITALMNYLATHGREFSTGIAAFDKRGIVPARRAVFYFIAGKGMGKTWFCINCGKRALREGKRVLHVTLENTDDETQLRYLQSLFAITKWQVESTDMTVLDFEEVSVGHDATRNEFTGWHIESVPVPFNFQVENIEEELENHLALLGRKIDNLVIKHFPNRWLTPERFEGYLDSLEATTGFVPDLVLLDYPKLMKVDMRDPRRSIGNNMERVRGIAVERNFAVVAPDQLTRHGMQAMQGRSTDVSEDITQVYTSDIVVIMSATDAEKRLGLARLFVDHARTERDRFGVLITQNYNIGQFVVNSTLLPPGYFDEMLSQVRNDAGYVRGEEENME